MRNGRPREFWTTGAGALRRGWAPRRGSGCHCRESGATGRCGSTAPPRGRSRHQPSRDGKPRRASVDRDHFPDLGVPGRHHPTDSDIPAVPLAAMVDLLGWQRRAACRGQGPARWVGKSSDTDCRSFLRSACWSRPSTRRGPAGLALLKALLAHRTGGADGPLRAKVAAVTDSSPGRAAQRGEDARDPQSPLFGRARRMCHTEAGLCPHGRPR